MRPTTDQKLLLRAGTIWSLHEALTGGFLIVFALALGASNTIVGILGAVPYIATLLMELPGAKLVEYFKRKTIFLIAATFARTTWLLITIAPYVFKEHPLLFVGTFFFFARCMNFLADPAWISWAADLVPDKTRGAFWAQWNVRTSLSGMLVTVLAGAFLDLFPKESLLGFATLFIIGALLGLWSNKIMAQVREPAYKDHDKHGFKEFFKIGGQFRMFCVIMMTYTFAVMLASPLFTPYMLENLGLSYTYFVLAGAIATTSRIISHPYFGHLSDRYGDRPVALISMFGTALVPLLFVLVTRENLWLIIPVQIISGIVWAGTDLATFNLLLDMTNREKRALQIAEYSFLISIPNITGPIIGGLVADNLAILGLTGIPLVFIIAGLLRMITTTMLTRIHEKRTGKEHKVSEVITHAISMHPVNGIEKAIKVVVKRVKTEIKHGHVPYPARRRLSMPKE